jgi:hypothetical protein
VQVLVSQIEHAEPLPRDVEHMNPHKVVETHRAVGDWMRLPFWSGKVASCSLSAWRIRYSKAA